MAAPRWEVRLGSPVLAADGEYGRLQQLILDPYEERVVALLVRKHGLLTSHSIFVPEEAVVDMTEGEVRLGISREQLDALPEYRPDIGLVVTGGKYRVDDGLVAVRGAEGIEVYRASTGQQLGLESQPIGSEQERVALQLRAGHQVFCQDGHAGRVSLLLLDPRGRVKGFVMHAGRLAGRNRIVPAAWVQEVDPGLVHLSVEKHALESLPEYSADDALAADVNKALWADGILRGADYCEIDATVQDGIVRLRGHVDTEINKSRAEEAARSIAALGIESHLVVDEHLVIRVAQALGRDERTRVEQVYVGGRNGVIVLNGRVASAAVRDAAEEVAASVPQVRGIVNEIQAPGVLVSPEEHKVLEPAIGRGVYATDMLLGTVERVIIHPRNRRVTSFVAHGHFPDLQHADEHRLPYEIPQQERRVVVPIRSVRSETGSSVWLDINGIEAARYRDFDSADFASPPEGWRPPYPYHRGDVLFAREKADGPKRPNSSEGPRRGEDDMA